MGTNSSGNSGHSANEVSRVDHLPTIVVAVVDEATLTRECLAQYIQAKAPDFVVRAIAHTYDSANGDSPPGVVIVNGKAFDLAGGELSREIRSLTDKWPAVPRLVISEREAPPAAALDAVRRGWQGYFPASESTELLIAAIRLIAHGGIFLPVTSIQACMVQLTADQQ